MKRITIHVTENFNPAGPGTELIVDEYTYQYEVIDTIRSYFDTAERLNTSYKSVGVPTHASVIAIVHNDENGTFQSEIDSWIKEQYREYRNGK